MIFSTYMTFLDKDANFLHKNITFLYKDFTFSIKIIQSEKISLAKESSGSDRISMEIIPKWKEFPEKTYIEKNS